MSSSARPRRLAAMGGAYGNLPALEACLNDAAKQGADLLAFLGDAIGCCGHSEEVVALVRNRFSVLVAGNHEQQAAAGAQTCGCGYSSPEDEAISCEAFQLATTGLSDETRGWLGTWPDRAIVELEGGRVFLCHGSPAHTSEFLYEVELDDLRLEAWLDEFEVRGFVGTHSGLPFVRRLRGGRFAANCGVVGKPDHDGDPAVHYAFIELEHDEEPKIEIRRVTYDHEAWAREMESVGIAPVFVEPVRTGLWTTGIASLPAAERGRWARAAAISQASRAASWVPERLDRGAFARTLSAFRELGLLSHAEAEEVAALLGSACPFFAAARLADSIHVHVKVDSVAALPHETIRRLGTRPENERDGYVKYSFAGGINLIFSSIPIAEEDTLPPSPAPTLKPFVDHVGIDLRRPTGEVRAVFDEIPPLARRAGWAHESQGTPRTPVSCCHARVAEKRWVFPPREDSRWTRPVELSFGPLTVRNNEMSCDLRPLDPRDRRKGAISSMSDSRRGGR